MDPSRTKPALAQRIQQTPIVYAPSSPYPRSILGFKVCADVVTGPLLRGQRVGRRGGDPVVGGEEGVIGVVGVVDRDVDLPRRRRILIRRWRIIMSRLIPLVMILEQ